VQLNYDVSKSSYSSSKAQQLSNFAELSNSQTIISYYSALGRPGQAVRRNCLCVVCSQSDRNVQYPGGILFVTFLGKAFIRIASVHSAEIWGHVQRGWTEWTRYDGGACKLQHVRPKRRCFLTRSNGTRTGPVKRVVLRCKRRVSRQDLLDPVAPNYTAIRTRAGSSWRLLLVDGI